MIIALSIAVSCLILSVNFLWQAFTRHDWAEALENGAFQIYLFIALLYLGSI